MKHRTPPSAFTILEVLLALGLLVVLTGGIYAFLWNLLISRDELSATAAHTQAADALIERLEADLLGAVAGEKDLPGLVGTASELTVRARGVVAPLAGSERDAALADMQGTRITFDESAGALMASRWTGDEPGGRPETLSAGVQRLRLRYYDGRNWQASFDSEQAGTLPVAVEVAIWFGPPLAADDELSRGVPEPIQPVTDELLRDDNAPPEPPTEPGARPVPTRAPDRRRLILVPDGPVAAWKEARR